MPRLVFVSLAVICQWAENEKMEKMLTTFAILLKKGYTK